MSFPVYCSYQDTGVKWIGKVPAHWDIARFRHHFQESPEKIEAEVVGVMLSVSGYRGIEIKEYDDENRRRLDEELVNYRIVRVGQLVVNSMWLNAGGLGVSEFEGHVSPAYRCYWINDCFNLRYVHHLLRSGSYVDGYTSMVQGVRPNSLQLGRNDLMNLPILIPPIHEQQAIASFLDVETSKIDSLVAEQRRLIELLKEKRQAVISHAVAKGLNPNAPMKPSGIQWLGDVPAHWEIRRLKTVTNFVTSGPRGWSERIADDGSIFVQSGDLSETLQIEFENSKRVQVGDDAETTRTQLFDGDVVICVTGAKTGNVAVCKAVPETAYVNQHLCLVRPNDKILPMFLGIQLKSDLGQTYFDLSQYGLKQGLSLENVKEAPVVVPPIDEQSEIVSHIEDETAKFDSLEAEAERAIELLQERRTALISAAVTGKIDVRGFSTQEAA